MSCLLLLVCIYLPFWDFVIGTSGMVLSMNGPLLDLSIGKRWDQWSTSFQSLWNSGAGYPSDRFQFPVRLCLLWCLLRQRRPIVQCIMDPPGKMTLRDAYLIEKLYLRLWSVGYLTHGTMKSYGPAHRLDYYDTRAIMCTWYYTSCCIQQTWNQTAKCTSLHAPKCALKYTLDCTRLYTPSLLGLCSQVSSQDALNHTPEHALKYTPNCTRWHTPSLLDYTLQSQLSRRSQSHHWARSQVHSQLHSIAHSQPAWLYAPK